MRSGLKYVLLTKIRPLVERKTSFCGWQKTTPTVSVCVCNNAKDREKYYRGNTSQRCRDGYQRAPPFVCGDETEKSTSQLILNGSTGFWLLMQQQQKSLTPIWCERKVFKTLFFCDRQHMKRTFNDLAAGWSKTVPRGDCTFAAFKIKEPIPSSPVCEAVNSDLTEQPRMGARII